MARIPAKQMNIAMAEDNLSVRSSKNYNTNGMNSHAYSTTTIKSPSDSIVLIPISKATKQLIEQLIKRILLLSPFKANGEDWKLKESLLISMSESLLSR